MPNKITLAEYQTRVARYQFSVAIAEHRAEHKRLQALERFVDRNKKQKGLV